MTAYIFNERLVTREHLDMRLRETELRLEKEIEQTKKKIAQVQYSMLKWQIGIGVGLAAIMAKGFGWLGF